jgi:hypothetical protein
MKAGPRERRARGILTDGGRHSAKRAPRLEAHYSGEKLLYGYRPRRVFSMITVQKTTGLG